MAEDDGSFEAAKNHGMAHNHEVIEKIKSYAPADNTRVASPSGPNADSRQENLAIKNNREANDTMDRNGENSILSGVARTWNNAKISDAIKSRNVKDAARDKTLKGINVK